MRHWKISLFTMFLVLSSGAQAAPAPVYAYPTLEHMIDFMFANGYVDPNNVDQLSQYVMIKDCKLFKDYYRNDFTWNKIKTRIINEQKSLQKDVVNHFILPVNFTITRYNFKTMAFDLAENSQLKNVNHLQLFKGEPLSCDRNAITRKSDVLPLHYDLTFDTPVSLYRLPMAQNMAQQILPGLPNRPQDALQQRLVYASIYLTVDSVLGITGADAVLLGRLDKIDFFLDQSRTQKIKTLWYSDL